MIILVSNDDGIHSEGLHALEEALKAVGEIYTVAPDREQNAVSHALTLHRPLRIEEIAPRRFDVNVPNLPRQDIKGYRLTRQGKRRYAETIEARVDPRGKKYYWIGGDDLGFDPDEGTDCVAVHEGFIP